MKILIKFPTRSRPDLFFKTLDLYCNMASNLSNIHFLVSIDKDDPTMSNADVNEKLTNYENLQFVFGESKSKIDAVNRDMELVSFDYDIILLASDDMIPQVNGYDKIIEDKMKEYYPDTDGVLFFNDGYRCSVLNTLCIFGKKYYERFNYIYYPGYVSMFPDNEFTDVAYLFNKQTYFDECIIKHEHPDNGFPGMARDHIHFLNNKNFKIDEQLYLDRKSNNFFIEKL